MPNINNLILKIQSGKCSARELQNAFANANNNQKISEEQREEVIESVEHALREHHPRAAKKLLGALDSRPIEVLEEMYTEIQKAFDLSQNKVKNGVKAGGSMRSGEAVLDWHISYKNEKAEGVVVGAYQWKVSDPLKYKVFKYRTANKPGSTYDEVEFIEESPDILVQYKKILSDLLPTNV